MLEKVDSGLSGAYSPTRLAEAIGVAQVRSRTSSDEDQGYSYGLLYAEGFCLRYAVSFGKASGSEFGARNDNKRGKGDLSPLDRNRQAGYNPFV
jgi:hypothetical protein